MTDLKEFNFKGGESKYVAFTWFPDREVKDWAGLFANSPYKHAKWQIEKSPETGKLHLQGCAAADGTKTRKSHKDVLAVILSNTVHVELCKKAYSASVKYCGKCETRVSGPWEYGDLKRLNEVKEHVPHKPFETCPADICKIIENCGGGKGACKSALLSGDMCRWHYYDRAGK